MLILDPMRVLLGSAFVAVFALLVFACWLLLWKQTSGAAYNNVAYWKDLHCRYPGKLTAVGFDSLGKGYNKVTYKLRLGAVEALLRRREIKPKRLLEAGVGVGAYGPLWSAYGVREWVGLDLSPEAIQFVAGQHSSGVFFTADITRDDLNVAGLMFDLVACIDVLYHQVDDTAFCRALTALGKRVRPGGYLLVSDVFCDCDRLVAPHVKRRSLATYRSVLDALGFDVVDRESVYSILGDPTPSSAFDARGQALALAWWLVSNFVRSLPVRWRDA